MLFYNSFIIFLSISLSATDPLPRGPNLCADNYVDSAFSVGKEMFLTRETSSFIVLRLYFSH
jgi:hypothetical protein